MGIPIGKNITKIGQWIMGDIVYKEKRLVRKWGIRFQKESGHSWRGTHRAGKFFPGA